MYKIFEILAKTFVGAMFLVILFVAMVLWPQAFAILFLLALCFLVGSVLLNSNSEE